LQSLATSHYDRISNDRQILYNTTMDLEETLESKVSTPGVYGTHDDIGLLQCLDGIDNLFIQFHNLYNIYHVNNDIDSIMNIRLYKLMCTWLMGIKEVALATQQLERLAQRMQITRDIDTTQDALID
jgi:hypothetical protein